MGAQYAEERARPVCAAQLDVGRFRFDRHECRDGEGGGGEGLET